jgi:hypothetical protein
MTTAPTNDGMQPTAEKMALIFGIALWRVMAGVRLLAG